MLNLKKLKILKVRYKILKCSIKLKDKNGFKKPLVFKACLKSESDFMSRIDLSRLFHSVNP